MKALLTPLMLSLLAITVVSPALAAGGGIGTGQDHGGPGYAFNAVVAPIDDSANALGDLKADDGQAILIGLLLPAIQKVRDAANRSASACPGDSEIKNSLDFDCTAETLSAMILDSTTGRDGSPGLLNLVAAATGEPIKHAKLFVRKQGSQGAPGTEKMVIAILIGLTKELDEAKIADGSVRDPLDAAIKIAEEIDPANKSAKPTSAGWDLATNKKV